MLNPFSMPLGYVKLLSMNSTTAVKVNETTKYRPDRVFSTSYGDTLENEVANNLANCVSAIGFVPNIEYNELSSNLMSVVEV